MILIELENIYQTGPIWIHRKWTRTWKPPFSVPYRAKYYLEEKWLLMFVFFLSPSRKTPVMRTSGVMFYLSLCWNSLLLFSVLKSTFMWRLLFSPGFLQACRALMIIALILGLFSMIVSILGLKCIQVGSSSDQAKAKKAVAGGVLFILAGEFLLFSLQKGWIIWHVCVIICISYTNNIQIWTILSSKSHLIYFGPTVINRRPQSSIMSISYISLALFTCYISLVAPVDDERSNVQTANVSWQWWLGKRFGFYINFCQRLCGACGIITGKVIFSSLNFPSPLLFLVRSLYDDGHLVVRRTHRWRL